ncbi:MAG: class I SAM-dependent methyltransferase [Solirubrobacterales bacterium]
MACRICEAEVHEILDLGATPPANLLKSAPEVEQESYPLVLEWCESCGNVQLRDTLSAEELYRDYLYVTPRSSMLSEHYSYLSNYLQTNDYLKDDAFVVEVGSNAGYFLEHLRPKVGQVLGVDPAENIVAEANANGIPTVCDFFNAESAAKIAEQHGKPQMIAARHCMAHNPTPHEMVSAAASLLAEDGYFVIENAYVLNTVENTEFDQIYHEHMFYYSIQSMKKLLSLHGMQLVDTLMSLVHGGSIIFVAKLGSGEAPSDTVHQYEAREKLFLNADSFARFAQHTSEIKDGLRTLISELNDEGKTIYSYGATAKGNTLLNYVGLSNADIKYCVDSTELKQGLTLPKSNIEIISEETAAADPPDYFLLTAWNYEDEIVTKVRKAGNYKSKFIVPIPFIRIV